MKKYTFYSNDSIVIIFYIALAFLTILTMYEKVFPIRYFSVYIAYIAIITLMSIEDNFRHFKYFMQIPVSMVIYSLLPAFLRSKEIGEKFVDYNTNANPTGYEGYAPVYSYSIHINIFNINYGFLSDAIIVTIIMLLLHYKKIEIVKMEMHM